jgi:hypothetical protein
MPLESFTICHNSLCKFHENVPFAFYNKIDRCHLGPFLGPSDELPIFVVKICRRRSENQLLNIEMNIGWVFFYQVGRKEKPINI